MYYAQPIKYCSYKYTLAEINSVFVNADPFNNDYDCLGILSSLLLSNSKCDILTDYDQVGSVTLPFDGIFIYSTFTDINLGASNLFVVLTGPDLKKTDITVAIGKLEKFPFIGDYAAAFDLVTKAYSIDNTKPTIILSYGYLFPVMENFISTAPSLPANYNSVCFNPTKNVVNGTLSSITKFYYYENGISMVYPEKLILDNSTILKMNLPTQTRFITFTTSTPLCDSEKVYPMASAIALKQKTAVTATKSDCMTYLNIQANQNLIAASEPPLETNVEQYKDILSTIVSTYVVPNITGLTIVDSTNKYIRLIYTSTTLYVFMNKTSTAPLITGEFKTINVYDRSFQIDNSYDNTFIKQELQSLTTLPSLYASTTNIILIGVNFEIHHYLDLLQNSLSLDLSKSSILILGLASVTKGYAANPYPKSYTVNIYSDYVILQSGYSLYSQYDVVVYDVLTDTTINDQTCLNTIFGYHQYIS